MLNGAIPTLYRVRNGSEYQFDHLERGILSTTKPCAMDDDPYESRMDISPEGVMKEFEKIVIAIRPFAEDLGFDFTLLLPKIEECRMAMKLLIDRMTLSNDIYDYYRKIRRIACLTEDVPGRVMWKNFGADGKGFLLEYDLNHNILDANGNVQTLGILNIALIPTKYGDIYNGDAFMAYYLFQKILTTRLNLPIEVYDVLEFTRIYAYKKQYKSYENEWRLISQILEPNSPDYGEDFFIHPRVVFFGPEIEEKDRNRLIDICNRNKISYRQLSWSDIPEDT